MAIVSHRSSWAASGIGGAANRRVRDYTFIRFVHGGLLVIGVVLVVLALMA